MKKPIFKEKLKFKQSFWLKRPILAKKPEKLMMSRPVKLLEKNHEKNKNKKIKIKIKIKIKKKKSRSKKVSKPKKFWSNKVSESKKFQSQ